MGNHDNNLGIGKRVKQLLNESNEPNYMLAKALNVTPGHMYKLIRGDAGWSDNYIESAAEYFGVTSYFIKYGDMKWDNCEPVNVGFEVRFREVMLSVDREPDDKRMEYYAEMACALMNFFKER